MKIRSLHLLLLPLFALALLVSCTSKAPPSPAPPLSMTDLPGTPTNTVIIKSSLGDMTLDLYGASAPKTVENFVKLAETGYYNGLTFHRVIPDFMIQGGDPSGDGTGGTSVFGETFEDEINAASYGLDQQKIEDILPVNRIPPELQGKSVQQFYESQGYKYNSALQSLPMKRGVIAMANRGPDTNGSQFFIIQNKDGTPWLEAKHTPFGIVTAGLDILDKIATAPADENNKPLEPITFTVEVVK